ncbi:SAM-dependent methyltransferase [Pelagibacterium halotolerans]|uniref:SAM-dependent methyltransferase n=1 Tax=Pelagibacterium halotolerans TaxID=531813 RepID=UPI0038502DE1
MRVLSPRLKAVVDALPLVPGTRVLEIGCGPGAMAREMAMRVGSEGHVLGIDRSAKAISQAEAGSRLEIGAGTLRFRQVKAEDFVLLDGEAPFDIVVAIRVGAFDGRHPQAGEKARPRIAAALKPGGRFFIDGGAPLREIVL